MNLIIRILKNETASANCIFYEERMVEAAGARGERCFFHLWRVLSRAIKSVSTGVLGKLVIVKLISTPSILIYEFLRYDL